MGNCYHHLRTTARKMARKEIIRRQFDIQAQGFSNWSVTRNEEYMQAYFEFIGFQKEDELLDVAGSVTIFL